MSYVSCRERSFQVHSMHSCLQFDSSTAQPHGWHGPQSAGAIPADGTLKPGGIMLQAFVSIPSINLASNMLLYIQGKSSIAIEVSGMASAFCCPGFLLRGCFCCVVQGFYTCSNHR